MHAIRLICVPFAGAGASFFNAWRGVAEGLELVPMQLPGREKRFLEPAHEDLHAAADELSAHLLADNDDQPALLFGHSLGAVLAFELARRLEASARFPLLGAVVSGSPDPWSPRAERASDQRDDDAFIADVSRFSDYRHEALDDPMMRELLLPTLRADVRMHEEYRPRSGAGLGVPLMTVRGAHDALVSAAQVAGWSRASSAQCTHRELPGGHMYFIADPASLLQLIERFARSLLAATAADAAQ
ncbi:MULTISPECIES: alpha/beta fold hydrolase [unclassified Xanthomonas]|uniref:thioesterase II family protein n=1 Tax=unclassified Xanthomonas TaxID=2643310 RepID=UPI002A7F864B|nr:MULTISPECIES: alpha/beta fold hydrolase [unclassified Xanthomonas]MDY4298103.1 alpha/beta fold hydrolase [Xanthomonas sp. LF02-5]MDY4359830.1 alpha/beta fold hydrolase [Xanthomonas sp. LF04-12]